MFRPIVPCACCFENVDKINMKISHYFDGCGCPVSPLVCADCRNDHHLKICRWCQRKGVYTSRMVSRRARDIVSTARDWKFTQERFSNVSIPYIMQIRLNWLKYLEFEKIKLYEYYKFDGYGEKFYRAFSETIAISFFSSFMQAQMFHITCAQRISKKYGISQKLFWLVKNITVARMLICNLFGESKNTRFFTERRKILKSNNNMMSIVLHRLLSNFALLIL